MPRCKYWPIWDSNSVARVIITYRTPVLILNAWALLILQPLHHFSYVTAPSPTLPSVYLRHSSFSNPAVASPTSQFILQPFRCFTYVRAHSPTLLSLLLRHKLFTYVTWRTAMLTGKYWPIWDSNSVSRVIITNPIPGLILNCISNRYASSISVTFRITPHIVITFPAANRLQIKL